MIIELILFSLIGIVQNKACFLGCLQNIKQNKYSKSVQQIFNCDFQCKGFITVFDRFECVDDCLNNQYDKSQVSQEVLNFGRCQLECHETSDLKPTKGNIEIEKMSFLKRIIPQNKVEKQILKILQDPRKHEGFSLEPLQCSSKQKKKKIHLKNGHQRQTVQVYLQTRCDLNTLLQVSEQNLYMRWTDIQSQINWDRYKGDFLVNHVQGIEKLALKTGLVQILKDYDNLQLYKFDSTQFHAAAYVFDLDSEVYTLEEVEGLLDLKDGIWITKIPSGTRGIGISLHKNPLDIIYMIKQIKKRDIIIDDDVKYLDQYSFVQKYIDNPVLIDNFKADIRSYILIVSTDPYIVLYQEGFAKRCISEYDNDFFIFDQLEGFKHLTNKAYQKQHPDYKKEKENLMLTPQEFRQQLKKQGYSTERINKLFQKGEEILTYTFLAAQQQIKKLNTTFEFLGPDLMWDDQDNVWLIEVNNSPGLYNELKAHKNVVPQLLQTGLDLIFQTYDNGVSEVWSQPENLNLGRWKVLINEVTGFNLINNYKNN